MDLERFPRRRYTACITPIEKLPRFSAVLDGPDISRKEKTFYFSIPADPSPYSPTWKLFMMREFNNGR